MREMGCRARKVREGEGLGGTWIGEDGLGQGNVYEDGDGLLEGDGFLVEIGWERGSIGKRDALGWRWVGEVEGFGE